MATKPDRRCRWSFDAEHTFVFDELAADAREALRQAAPLVGKAGREGDRKAVLSLAPPGVATTEPPAQLLRVPNVHHTGPTDVQLSDLAASLPTEGLDQRVDVLFEIKARPPAVSFS